MSTVNNKLKWFGIALVSLLLLSPFIALGKWIDFPEVVFVIWLIQMLVFVVIANFKIYDIDLKKYPFKTENQS